MCKYGMTDVNLMWNVLSQVELLYLTYGVMYGLGASLAYTPSLVILGHYFKKYLGLVNGVVTAGSSVFTTLIPYLMEFLLRRLGLEGLLRCMAVLTAVVMACAILFKPIPCELFLEILRKHSLAIFFNSNSANTDILYICVFAGNYISLCKCLFISENTTLFNFGLHTHAPEIKRSISSISSNLISREIYWF